MFDLYWSGLKKVQAKPINILDYTVFRVIFTHVIFALQHTVLPCLKFVQTCLCTKQITWNIGILPVLNSPTDNKGESRENKTRANILIYTVEDYTIELEDDEYMK